MMSAGIEMCDNLFGNGTRGQTLTEEGAHGDTAQEHEAPEGPPGQRAEAHDGARQDGLFVLLEAVRGSGFRVRGNSPQP